MNCFLIYQQWHNACANDKLRRHLFMKGNSNYNAENNVKYIWQSFTAMKPRLLLDEKNSNLYHFLITTHVYF